MEGKSVRVASVLDDDTVTTVGNLEWLPLRRELGVEAFGINAFRAAKAGDPVIEEHVESPGQEEAYLVVAGSAQISLGEESITAPVGTIVFVPDPTLERSGEALEDNTVVVALGGWPDQAYHPLPWEPIYLAMEAMRRGNWAEAAETLEREAGSRAIEINPDMRKRAGSEDHFASLRENFPDRFPA